MSAAKSKSTFYGWWIVGAAFVNLFLTTGIVYYGFPVFYVSLTQSLGFTRQQAVSGNFYGFVLVAPLFGLLAGVLIDRLGPRAIILCGIGFSGLSFIFLGMISSLWAYYFLCLTEVIGYVLSGPIPNQVLVANWFRKLRGRAMGYAYLGLGLGGVAAPVFIHWLIENFGWRRAFEAIGVIFLIVLFPVGIWITRSAPQEAGLLPDGAAAEDPEPAARDSRAVQVRRVVRTPDFWLLLIGSSLVIGAIGAVISNFILFVKDAGHSVGWASRALSILLVASLAGRVTVGYVADKFTRKNVMALFYLVLASAIPLLLIRDGGMSTILFALIFGFAMGADYMLIPLVAADCFGLAALGKILAIIIMADSVAQSGGAVLAAHIFDVHRSYHLAWEIVTLGGILGALGIYLISTGRAARLTGAAYPATENRKVL